MESSAIALISEIGPQHHLVVNEEGIVQFTDDGEELLVYDDLIASIVRVPSCPVVWKHFGLEIQPDNTVTSQLAPITLPDTEIREEIEIKDEIIDYEIETTATTIEKVNDDKDDVFKQSKKPNMLTNKSLAAAWEELQKNKIIMEKSTKQMKHAKKLHKSTKAGNTRPQGDTPTGNLFRDHFTVRKFTPEEQIIEFEKRKENRQKYLERLYKCKTCYRGFQLQENYAKHVLCHMVKTKYYCDICRLYLDNKSIYHSHISQHKQKFICKHCDFESYHRASSSLHARAHSINLPLSYQSFMNNTKNGSRARFVCCLCGFSFVNEVGLKLHTRKTHRGDIDVPENGPTCSLCNVVFLNEQAFLMHCRIMHSEYVPRKSDSEDAFDQPDSPNVETTVCLESDEYVISTEDPLQTDEIDSEESSQSPSFLCYLCGATFLTDNELEFHISYHDEETENPGSSNDIRIEVSMDDDDDNGDGDEDDDDVKEDLNCAICGKAFSDPVLLYRHVHSHKYAIRLKQQSRRPECPRCGMTFSSFSNRLRHIKYAHTEVRPSICSICPKAFKSEPELKSHIDHVHLKKPWPKRNRGRGGRELSPF